MRKVALLTSLVFAYIALVFPLAAYMRSKPFAEKLGHVPQGEVIRLLSADQKQFVAASLVMKVLFYFGSLVEKAQNKIIVPPDYFSMYKNVEASVKLDPYNMDSYYFAQAILAWDVRKIKLANDMLEYGMKYRTWDFYLPLFAGFNNAYFLKDYAKAAEYYKRVAELTGDELFIKLTGRYLQESGQTEHALIYLSIMQRTARNDAIKKSIGIRLRAFQGVRRIEVARDRYLHDTGKMPSAEQLLAKGYLKELPVDPYGGSFYIDGKGAVRSTSKFAPGVKK